MLTALGGLARVVQGPIPETRQIYAKLRLTPICQPEEALAACATTLAGKPAAGSTQRRKRSVFYNALGYAVELGLLGSNRSTGSSGPPPPSRRAWTAGSWSAPPRLRCS
ncbi:MAG TPA: hypothetical protein VF060_31485 [Trebonia sp.]